MGKKFVPAMSGDTTNGCHVSGSAKFSFRDLIYAAPFLESVRQSAMFSIVAVTPWPEVVLMSQLENRQLKCSGCSGRLSDRPRHHSEGTRVSKSPFSASIRVATGHQFLLR